MTARARSGGLIAGVGLCLACAHPLAGGPGDGPPGVTTPPPSFLLWGTTPYGWSKADGTLEGFRTDGRVCLDESTKARWEASPPERNDAAYRAFVDCMAAHHWQPEPVTPDTTFVPRAAERGAPRRSP